MTTATGWLGMITVSLLSVALLLSAFALFGDRGSLGQHAIRRYLHGLDVDLRFVRSRLKGLYVLSAQAALCLAVIGCALLQRQWVWLVTVPAFFAGPRVFLSRSRARRVAMIGEQVEPWINALANALKASPSLGEAICSTTTLVPCPISQELEVLVQEYELGSPLDRALDNLGARIGSRTLSGTVTALKIARRSGGNLTEMLETAAASLREFARLEGVVQTKTAEGKAQAFVIGLIPLPMVLGIYAADPHFFEPLTHCLLGQLIIAGAVVLWVIAVLASRKILSVDI